MMGRIPRIKNKKYLGNDPVEIVKRIDIDQFPKCEFDIDLDINNEKEFHKYLKKLKPYIRHSAEYTEMMSFLKFHRKLNRCFYLPKVRQYRGSKTKIEIHHSPFTMFDIIGTVVRKRKILGERLFYTDIGYEIMKLHYEGKVGLVSLATTTHELIHSENTPSDLFVPLQHLDFGNPDLFFEEYKSFMESKMITNYEMIKVLSSSIENINDLIPDYMELQYIYYKLDDTFKTQFPRLNRLQELLLKKY